MRFRFLILASVVAGPVAPTPVRAQSRPLVLVVHGRGHQARDTADLRHDAVRALRAGSANLTGDSLITDGDVRLVWYADILDARTAFSTDSTTCGASVGSGESASTSVFSMLAMLAGVIVEANAAEQEKQGGESLRGFAGDLRYLGDTRTRCAAESRLASALAQANAERRPVIVVAHSLGALVSWGHFQRRSVSDGDLPEIRRLVTLGSPLGSPGIRELVFGDARSSVRLPRSVRSWVNVVNEDDPFAVRVLADAGVHPESAAHVADLLTTRGGENPHEMRGYLRDRATARAIMESWCDAYEGKRGSVAKACGSLPSR